MTTRPHRVRLVAVVLAGLAGAALTPGPAQAAAGPVSAADRDFLATAHTTMSFAVAASQLAKSRGEPAVKTLGTKVAEADGKLGETVAATATKLQITLPEQADPALAKLEAAHEGTFDAAYVESVRATDGALLQAAAVTRVHTRNSIVRDLAQRTAAAMMAQLPLLEKSGLVDMAAIPPAPAASPPTAAAKAGPHMDPAMLAQARAGDGFLWPRTSRALLALAVALLLTFLAARKLTRRTAGRRRAR